MYDCIKEEELHLFLNVKASDECMLKIVGKTLHSMEEMKNEYKKWVEKARKKTFWEKINKIYKYH